MPGSIELDPGRTGIDEEPRVDFPSQLSRVRAPCRPLPARLQERNVRLHRSLAWTELHHDGIGTTLDQLNSSRLGRVRCAAGVSGEAGDAHRLRALQFCRAKAIRRLLPGLEGEAPRAVRSTDAIGFGAH